MAPLKKRTAAAKAGFVVMTLRHDLMSCPPEVALAKLMEVGILQWPSGQQQRFLRLLVQFGHDALDQLLRIGKTFHDDPDVEHRLARPALALAIDAVLADQRHRVGDHVHGHSEAAARDAHHGLKVFQLFALFFEYGHGVIVNKHSAFGTQRSARAKSVGLAIANFWVADIV